MRHPPDGSRRRFDADYREEVVLADGAPVVLRALRPDDKALLMRGFQRLSEASRFRRFLAVKEELTERELAYLTELDGERHYAIAAGLEDPLGREEGIGVARLIRLDERPEVAELAITVIDTFQGRGLGTLLCRRIAEAALERGITHVRCDVLAANDPIRRLLARVAPAATVVEDGDGVAVLEFPIAP